MIKAILILAAGVYIITLLLLSFPFSPVLDHNEYNCEITKRIDYIFPARQIYCFLDEEQK